MSARFLPGILALAALAAASGGRAEVQVLHRSFPGGPGAALRVECYHGQIAVEASPDGQFHVEVTLDSGTEDAARSARLLGEVKTEISQTGPEVSVRVRNPRQSGWHLDLGDQRPIAIECRCLVPSPCALNLSNRDGSVNVGDLAGRIRAQGRNGTLVFRSITGEIEASQDHGDIIISHCTGAVRLKTVVGGIRTGTIVGRVEATAVNGDIEIQHALGGAALSATVGDVTLGIPRDPAGETRVETDAGAITLRLDPESRCTIRASSVLGKVRMRTLLPLVVQSGGNGRGSLVGTLNGGGPLVLLHANGGQIRLEARPQ